MVKQDKDLCRIWDIVNNDHPGKSTEWCIQMTLDMYRFETKNSADVSDLMDALDKREDER